MHILDAELIPPEEAHALLAPILAGHLAGRDLQIALDDELCLADEYDRGGILLLPDGARISGDLKLDYDAAAHGGRTYRGIIALGDLRVAGDILNDDTDGGPFLVVLGALSVRHIIKGGAPIIVVGPLGATGIIYCEYNHGSFRAWGGSSANGIVIDDQPYDIAAPVKGPLAVLWNGEAHHHLLPEFFYEEDDGTIQPVDDLSEELKSRIRSGQPIFRSGFPQN